MIKDFKDGVKRTSVDEDDIKEFPFVSFNIKGETWIQATVTYAVEPKLEGELQSRLIKKIMKELKIMPE